MFRMFSSNSDTPLPSFHTNKNNNKASCINSRGKSWLYYLLPNFFSLMACSVFFESVPDFMIWKGLIKIAWLYHLTRKHFPILQSITIDSIHHLLMDYSIVEFMISFFRKISTDEWCNPTYIFDQVFKLTLNWILRNQKFRMGAIESFLFISKIRFFFENIRGSRVEQLDFQEQMIISISIRWEKSDWKITDNDFSNSETLDQLFPKMVGTGEFLKIKTPQTIWLTSENSIKLWQSGCLESIFIQFSRKFQGFTVQRDRKIPS